MRRTILSCAPAAVLAAAAGCSSRAEPTQPRMTDEQVKELMKQGKEESRKERGNRGPGR
jgi:hypothetical protein